VYKVLKRPLVTQPRSVFRKELDGVGSQKFLEGPASAKPPALPKCRLTTIF
jgi:hypothetical protein